METRETVEALTLFEGQLANSNASGLPICIVG